MSPDPATVPSMQRNRDWSRLILLKAGTSTYPAVTEAFETTTRVDS